MRGAQRRPSAALRRLAALYGVQTAYIDVQKRRQIAGADSLLAALRILGAPLAEGAEDAGAAAALREREQGLSSRLIDPVIVATCFVIGLIVTFVVSVIPRLREARKS